MKKLKIVSYIYLIPNTALALVLLLFNPGGFWLDKDLPKEEQKALLLEYFEFKFVFTNVITLALAFFIILITFFIYKTTINKREMLVFSLYYILGLIGINLLMTLLVYNAIK